MLYWQINRSGLLGEVQHELVVCMAVGVVVHSRVMRGPHKCGTGCTCNTGEWVS